MICKCGNGKRIAVHLADGLHDGVNHLNELLGALALFGSGVVNCCCPLCGKVDLNVCSCAGVDSVLVHLNDFDALLHELLCLFLHVADCFLGRKNLCK